MALAGLALIWGYGWTVTKVGFEYVEPYSFMALRSALSVLFLFGLMLALRRPLRPTAIGMTVLVGLLQTGVFTACTTFALSHTGAGKTAILTYTMPFWLLILAWAFLGERLRGLQWPAVGLAFCGLLLVIEPWNLTGVAASVMAVFAGLIWASAAILVKMLRRRHAVDALSLTAWQMLFGTPLLVVIAAFAAPEMPSWSLPLAGVLAYNVLLANGIAWVLWAYALRALTAGGAGLGTLAIPILSVVTAWLQLGERPSPAEALGMALVVGALALLSAREITEGARLRSRARRAGAAPL